MNKWNEMDKKIDLQNNFKNKKTYSTDKRVQIDLKKTWHKQTNENAIKHTPLSCQLRYILQGIHQFIKNITYSNYYYLFSVGCLQPSRSSTSVPH